MSDIGWNRKTKPPFVYALSFALFWGLFAFFLSRQGGALFPNIKKFLWLGFGTGVFFFAFLESLLSRKPMESMLEEAHFEKDDFQKTSAVEKAKLSAILENMAEGVVGISVSREVLIMNPSAQKMLGVQEASAVGKSFLEVTKNTQMDEMMKRALETQKSVQGEMSFSFPEKKIVKANAIGLEKNEGHVAGILVFYDITEFRNLERSRQEFVANVSHELKTPLTSIKGFIETLLDGAFQDSDKSKNFLGIIKEDTDRLERLIEDLLHLSRIESKRLDLQLSSIPLKAEVEKQVVLFRQKIEQQKIQIENQIDPEQMLCADPDRFKQVLINLLDNAIKFNSPGGKVTLFSKATSEGLEFCIQDQGVGIAEKDIARVFERFYRVDKARSRDLGGNGLGLSIVKHIVEAHGGNVSCESRPGKGSTFKVFFPTK